MGKVALYRDLFKSWLCDGAAQKITQIIDSGDGKWVAKAVEGEPTGRNPPPNHHQIRWA